MDITTIFIIIWKQPKTKIFVSFIYYVINSYLAIYGVLTSKSTVGNRKKNTYKEINRID